MNVLFVTSEAAGLAKTGGLADVSAALPKALRDLEAFPSGSTRSEDGPAPAFEDRAFSERSDTPGVDVRILMPGYAAVLKAHPHRVVVANLPGLADLPPCSIEEVRRPDGTIVYLVVSPELYDRQGTPYADPGGNDWPDNDRRFARLGLAAAEIAAGATQFPWRVDLVHGHDWPASLAPAYLAWRGATVPTVQTIHNLAHQGLFDPTRMAPLGIPPEAYSIEGVEFHGRISFLKGGLYFADQVTTVSPTYAQEITTSERGCGLHGLLSGLAAERRLTGILNGIDEAWFDEPDARRRPNARPTEAVRTSFCLEPSDGPLFGFVARLDPQKGLDVLIESARRVVDRGGQLAILGTGQAELERQIVDLAKLYRGAVGAQINYAEPLARRILTAADFLLVPSRFEPCGLTQMYAQRCGSLPIAHATGGLADTIDDGRTGFLYRDYRGLPAAIDRAFEVFAEADRLEDMRREARIRDFSWSGSARAYVDVYARATARAAERAGALSVSALAGHFSERKRVA